MVTPTAYLAVAARWKYLYHLEYTHHVVAVAPPRMVHLLQAKRDHRYQCLPERSMLSNIITPLASGDGSEYLSEPHWLPSATWTAFATTAS